MFFNVCLIVVSGIKNVCCNSVIEGICVEALALAMIIISRANFPSSLFNATYKG